MASLLSRVDLCSIAAAKPPAGEVSNLVNPTTLSPVTISICVILTIIYAHTTIVGAVLFFPKCAIFFMYRQLFQIRRPVRIAIWAGLAFSFAIYFPSIPLSAIYEAPRAGHSWEEYLQSLSTRHDSTLTYWGIVQGTCSVVLDLYIFVLPLPLLSQLHLARKKKIQLLVLFGTALFGVAASAIALYFRVQLLGSTDSTWRQAQLAICVVVENNVAITVASMPAFATFMRVHISKNPSLQKFLTKLSGSSTSRSYGFSGATLTPPANAAFGSPSRKNASDNYYELNDSVLLSTQITVADDEQPFARSMGGAGDTGIMRTAMISQHSEPWTQPPVAK
ncbi:hypothetical protein TruAng_005132 [Truncatella angustata]|nr:hypothetical protein TruAng_005132 [Truncatella angustata]